MNRLFGCCEKVKKSDEKMNTIDDKLDINRSVSGTSSGAGLDPTLSVARPSPAQSETDISKYTEELSKDPTVLRSANSIGRMFQGGSKQNVTTIFAQNLIEAATSDLLIEIESCSSMSSGSCESSLDMMDSVVNITGLINAEKKRIKGERSREDLGLLSQITKFKPISRETTETHQRESTHELVHRRDSKGATTEHLHRSQSMTTMADVRQGKIRTADGRTLRIKCSKTNEILRQKMIYNARQELAPPKKKKFKTIAKAVAWTVRNRLAFMKGDMKTKEQEEEEKLQKLAKIYATNMFKNATKKLEWEKKQEAVREERRRRANRRRFYKTPNFFGELEDFPDPTPWVQKFDKNHNKNNKALLYFVKEIQRQEMEHELGPPPPGLDLPCSNLSLRHFKHSDLSLARHEDTKEEPTIFSGRENSTIYFGEITKIGDSDSPQVKEEDKLDMAVGGAPAEDSPRTGKESTSKPEYLGGKSGGSSVTREAKAAGMTGLFPANDVTSGKKSPKSGGILKDDKKRGVKDENQSPSGRAAAALGPSAVDEPVPIWTKAPTEKKSWSSQDKPRDMSDPRVDAPYMMRSLTEVRSDKSAGELEEPPPAPRSSECLIKGTEGLGLSSGSSGGTPEAEPSQRQTGPSREGARVRATAVAGAGAVVPYSADDRVRTAIQKITVSVTEGMMARNPYLRILNRAVSIVDPIMQATEADTMEGTTLGLTRYFLAIMSGVLTRVAGLMPLIGATEEGGLPVLPSNAPADRTDTATSTGNRLMAIRATSPPSVSGVTDQKGKDVQPTKDRQKTTAVQKRKGVTRERERPRKKEAKIESDKKRSSSKAEKSDSQEDPEGKIWKVPDRKRRSSLRPDVVQDLKSTLQHREEERQDKKPTLHFTSQSSAVSQKSTVTKYGKGKKKDTATLETSQAMKKTALAYTPPPPPPPLPGCLPGGGKPTQAAPVVYTTQTAEVGQRAAVSSREQDGTEISTETATMATMMEAQFIAPPAPPPLPPPDYYLSDSDESDDEPLKEQAPKQKVAKVFLPPKYVDRFQSQGFRHVEFNPSPRSSAASSVAGSDVGSVRSSRASTPAGTPRSSSPVGTCQGVQSAALTTALRDVGENRDVVAHGVMQPRRDSLAFLLQSQSTKLKHSTTVRRKTSRGETEDTAETSHMVATVQAGRMPSPPPLPSFALGLSMHPGMTMAPLSPMTLSQALHDAIGRREHAMSGHVQSSSPGDDSLSFLLQSQATKLKHTTTVRRKTSAGETEDTAEASQMVGTVQASHVPAPSPIGHGAQAQIAPPAALAIPSPTPTTGMLPHHSAAPALPLPQLGGFGGLTDSRLSGGTAMRHTSTSAKMTQKTTVKKGDETVENVSEASQAMATTEVMNAPAPPPLPTPEQLRRPSLPQAAPHPNMMALQRPGPSALAIPQPPPVPTYGGGTFMRSTTASNKVTHKTKVTKGDETVENVAEASETMATMEAGHIPAAPPLPTREQLRRPSLPQAQPHLLMHGAGFGRVPSPPALPSVELLMSGISDGPGRVPSPPALPTRAFLMSGITGISDGSGRVPSPPALPTRAFLMSGIIGISGGSGRFPSPPAVPPAAFLMSGISHSSRQVANPPALPPMEYMMSGISDGPSTLPQDAPQPKMSLQMAGPSALMSPGGGQGGGTFIRSTTASNKMTHKTTVTKGDETVENVAEASETMATMEAGHIPAAPPLPTREQLRRPSLPQAQPHLLIHGAGFGRVPSPPALPTREFLMSGISGISGGSGRFPSPPAVPPAAFLMSGISHSSRQVANPPALPPMEFMMSGISEFPEREVSQASPRPLLDLVGSGAMQPAPDPNRQYTVMSVYAAQAGQESNLSQEKTAARYEEGTGDSTTEGFETKGAALNTNIPEPPPLPALKFFVPKPHVRLETTFEDEITQRADKICHRREMYIHLRQEKEDFEEFLHLLEKNETNCSPEKIEEMKAEANEELATIEASLTKLLMRTSWKSLVENQGSECSEVSLEPGEIVSTDELQTDLASIESGSQLSVYLGRQSSDESPAAELNQLSLCPETDHGDSTWLERDNSYQLVHGEDTPCCLAEHARRYTYRPPRFKCGSCDETLLVKYHLESDNEGEDEEEEGQDNVRVPVCHTKEHGHDHTWTYNPPRMRCKPCHVKMVMKMHVVSDEEDEDLALRSVPLHHRTPSRTLPGPNVVASEAGSAAGTAESSARQVQTPLENVKIRTTDGTSPPGSTAAKTDKQSAKGSAEPAGETQKGAVKGDKVVTSKDFSQKVWEALVGDDSEKECSKAQATPAKDAEKPSSASKDTGAKISMFGPEGSTKKEIPSQVKGPQETRPSGTQDNPKKTMVTSKDAPSKSMVSDTAASAPSTAKSAKTAETKSPPPSKDGKAPLKGVSGQKESTEEKKEKSTLNASQKGAKVPKAGPSGTQTAKLVPTKIPQPIKDTSVKRKTPVIGTAALPPKRIDVQTADTASVKETAPSPRRTDSQKTDKAPTKIPQPSKDREAKEKTPVKEKTALSRISTDKAPTKIPQPSKDREAKEKTPVKEKTALSRISTDKAPTKIPQPSKDREAKEKAPVKEKTALSRISTDKAPTKIPQPSKDREATEKTPVKEATALSPKRTDVQATDNAPLPPLPPTKIPQPVQGTAVRRKTPVIGTATLSPRRIDVQTADKASVKQSPPSPTKIPRPVQDTADKRKTPMMGTSALSPGRTDMQTADKTSVKETVPPLTKIPQPSANGANVQKTETASLKQTAPPPPPPPLPPTKIPLPVRRKTPMMGTTALSPRRADMKKTGKVSVKQTPPPLTKIPRPVQDTAVKRKTPVMGRNALSPRRKDESQGVETEPASMKTAGPSDPQTTDEPAETDDSEPKLPYGWVSSGIKKYTVEERARLDAEVDGYWGKKFSKNREKPWWNIVDPEEREAARLRHRSKTDLRPTGSSKGAPGATSASFKQPGFEKQVKYDVDRSPVMLPGHFGASTGVRSRASRPDVGLVPKKLEMEFFDSSEDSEDEIDLDKPVSLEDLQDDDYWRAMEKKAYTIVVKASMEQLETVDESPEHEIPVQEAKPTGKKLNNLSQMFQSRKEKEKRREREAREMAMKEKEEKKAHMFEHKSDPPNEEPFTGPPLPPEMLKNTPEKKKRGLTRHGHEGVPTLAAETTKEGEAGTSKKSVGRLTPTKLVSKIKGGFAKVKDSIKSKLSGESSDSSLYSDDE
ncbi:Hypp7422 [Branchiostoma lanceolatum]|uniref:Hypp7422 protein n=1 Tax=Branchiostoma lanceolatum TaxID=7740 RepID=A0A8J9Z005_BRALA|nr:Hypp7422 [Branchiostoma lanceolatum]